jgi:RND family efflux transporter MFP subunit
VRVAAARIASLTKSLPVTGSLVATQSVEVAPKLSARVTFLAGREGESIRAGQVVLRQDVSDLQTQVAASEAALRQAEAQVASASASIQSARARLAQARTQSRVQNTSSDAGVRDAEQQLASARAALEVAKKPQRTQEVRVAELAVTSARASYERAASDRKRYEELLKEGAVAQMAYEQYATQEKLARAQLDTAQQQLTLAREGGRAEAVRQAQASVSRAEWGLRLAKANTKQTDVRKDEVAAAAAALSQAEATLAQSQAGVAQARANVLAARQRVADGTVTSPIDGIIAKRSAEPGQMASPGATALTVVALDSVFFEAQVPEVELSGVRLGMPVEVRLDAYKGRTFPGRIARLYPSGSTSSRSFAVRVAIPNESGALRPGMFARGAVIQERRSGVVVPKDALVRTDSGPVVFVADGTKAVKRPIESGLSSAQTLEVKKGVVDGERIVVTGQSGLRDGAPIKIIDTQTAAAAEGR